MICWTIDMLIVTSVLRKRVLVFFNWELYCCSAITYQYNSCWYL